MRSESRFRYGGEAQLAEHEAARCAIELGVRQVGNQEWHMLLLKPVMEVEHQPGPGEAELAVRYDRTDAIERRDTVRAGG